MKKYEVKEEEPLVARESVSAYQPLSCGVAEEHLSGGLLMEAAKYADAAREAGEMISNKDVYGMLADKLGWK